ncbi:3'5'-cyclic nucleotide phosphodiesterase [Cryptosporidium felis]|nr:3'5'-cyclic nucleotide phosphodiesterase [Cryptosporidium felis]
MKYSIEEIYEGVAFGRSVRKKSLAWNVWLGLGFTCAILLWLGIYSSRMFGMVYKLRNTDQLVEELRFDEQLASYGYNLGGLSLSIMTFCLMEKNPDLLNIPVRMGLSNQILKQRYMVRNSMEKLNELSYPQSRVDKREAVQDLINSTIVLLKTLVPLNFSFEDQPSPISPAPPPYYVPYRTSITEEEIRQSVESESSTFLAAKYLCNNTEHISELSDRLKFLAFEISNPSRFFDLKYLDKYFKEHDIMRLEQTRRILRLHYVVIPTILGIFLVVFYFGANDYFQRRRRAEMVSACKNQVIDLFQTIMKVDEGTLELIRGRFLPVSKIYHHLRIVCDGISRDYGEKIGSVMLENFRILSKTLDAFEKCVTLASKFSEILKKEVGKNRKSAWEQVRVSEIIEFDILHNNMGSHNHHFSEEVPKFLGLHGGLEDFNYLLESILKMLDPDIDKSIFWDVVHIQNDIALIPPSLVNSLGEVSSCVKSVIEDEWNYSASPSPSRDLSFLVLDVFPPPDRTLGVEDHEMGREYRSEGESYRGTNLLRILNNTTRSFHHLIAERMTTCVFGGTLITHTRRNSDKKEPRFDFKTTGDIFACTLIIPINTEYASSTLPYPIQKRNPTRIFSSGLDHKISGSIRYISTMLDIKYETVNLWALGEKESFFKFLQNHPGYWFLDTSTIHLFSNGSIKIRDLHSQSYYLENEIDVILLSVEGEIRVVSEYNNDVNLSQFYYSIRLHINGRSLETFNQSIAEVEKGEKEKYKEMIELLNRPISEVSPEIFEGVGVNKEKNHPNRKREEDILIQNKLFSLVNLEELLELQDKTESNEGTSVVHKEIDEWKPIKQEVLRKKWYNTDLLELNDQAVIEIAEFLVYYRYLEVLRDKDDYDEDISLWGINQQKIRNFVSKLNRYYHAENPFHNIRHAVSVSITLNNWLDKPSVRQYVNSLEAYCLMISSLGHDLDHPGLSNELVKEMQKISEKVIQELVQERGEEEQMKLLQSNAIAGLNIYNGFSLLENHHSSLLFIILSGDSCNILPPRTSKYFPTLKKMMVNSIIFTDMSHHFLLRRSISAFLDSDPLHGTEEKESWRKSIYLSTLLHSADISNPLMNTNIYLKWSKLVFEEFNHQLRIRMMLNIPSEDKYKNGDNKSYVESQIEFVQNVCLPYFLTLHKFDPDLIQDCIQNLYFNSKYFMDLSLKN